MTVSIDRAEARKKMAHNARRSFTDNRRRLGTAQKREAKKTVSTEETAIVQSDIERAKSVLTHEDYKREVWAAYQGNSNLKPNQLAALAMISYQYGLMPNPGLDLIYAWVQDGKFIVHIGYKGWLAIARRHKDFVDTYKALDRDETIAHGCDPDKDIVVECSLYDLDKAKELQPLIEAGILPPDAAATKGEGVFRKGDNVPKGRSPYWVARKRAVKDAATKMIVEVFNITAPDISADGGYYDMDGDSWVIDLDDDENTVEGHVSESQPIPESHLAPTEDKEKPQPGTYEIASVLVRLTRSDTLHIYVPSLNIAIPDDLLVEAGYSLDGWHYKAKNGRGVGGARIQLDPAIILDIDDNGNLIAAEKAG